MQETKTYRAFISYSHADRNIAKLIHRTLEHYHVPRYLVRSDYPRNVRPIFFDTEDIRAGSITYELQRALLLSEFLIVVCSQETPSSQWVNEEIETFLHSHTPDRVLLVLISNDFAESIPSPLKDLKLSGNKMSGEEYAFKFDFLTVDISATHYLYSIYRFRTEKLRILARILDCEFDELRRRSTLRQRRFFLVAAFLLLFSTSWIVWTRTDTYQIRKVLTEVPVAQAVLAEHVNMLIVEKWLKLTAYLGKVDEPLNAARQLKDVGDRTEALVAVIEGLVKAGMLDEALIVCSELKDQSYTTKFRGGSATNGGHRSNALLIIVNGFLKEGRTEEAIDVAREIGTQSDFSQALLAIAKKLITRGNIDNALSVMRQFHRHIDSEIVLSKNLISIAGELANVGRTEHANKLFDEALKVSNAFETDEDYYLDTKSEVLAAIAGGLTHIGQVEKAEQLLSEATDVAYQIDDKFHYSEALIAIAAGLTKVGRTDKASELLHEAMEAKRIYEGTGWGSHTFVPIAEGFIEARKIKEALDVARYRPPTLEAIAGQLVKAGAIDEAVRVARDIPEDSFSMFDPSSRSLLAISEELCSAGKLDMALDIARQIRKASHRSRALLLVAKGLREGERVNESREVLNEALMALGQISWGRDLSTALVFMADELVSAGKFVDALELARSIDIGYHSSRVSALVAIAKGLHRVGEVSNARRILHEASREAHTTTNVEESSEALLSVAKGFAYFHDFRRARKTAIQCAHPEHVIEAYMIILLENAKETYPDLRARLNALELSPHTSDMFGDFD